MKEKLFILALFVTVLSCSKSTVEENEEELITTLQVTLQAAGSGPLVFEFDDPDGPGGANPTQDEIIIAPNKTYTASLRILNRSVTPEEDMTPEVLAEADAHRFYFTPSQGLNLTVQGLNSDPGGSPLGTTSMWTTGAAFTGTLKITLRHYANDPPGKLAGDPVDSPKSSTDVEVTFQVRIQ